MGKNPQEILKEIDADFQYDYNKNAGFFLPFFIMGFSFLSLGWSLNFYGLKDMISIFDILFTIFTVLISLNGLYESALSLKANRFIKKKYGNNVNKAIQYKIDEIVQIEDIEKYYEKSSSKFRNDILDPILEKEIKKKLGQNKYNSLEVLKKLNEDNKIKITNV